MSILRNGLLPSISGKTDKFKELLDLHYIDHVPFVEISKKSVFQVLHYTDGFVPLKTKPLNFHLL